MNLILPSIIQSIKSQYCELIAAGKKTIEVRKTRPKLKPPFKVYIYCTKDKIPFLLPTYSKGSFIDSDIWKNGNGKVIGEYVCDEIEELRYDALEQCYIMRSAYGHNLDEEFKKGTCLTYKEAYEYCKNLKCDSEHTDMFYGWHISDLKIYDKPKELSDFYTICNKDDLDQCGDCKYIESYGASFPCEDGGDWWCTVDNKKPITRPPAIVVLL